MRTVLRLDLRYYQSSDSGLAREILHKLTMGAKQVVHRPMLLLDAVRTLNLRALILPDRKQILLDKDQPALKLRWHEAHEVAHGFIPWHPAYALGDDRPTLRLNVRKRGFRSRSKLGRGAAIVSERNFCGDVTRLTALYSIGFAASETLWKYNHHDAVAICGEFRSRYVRYRWRTSASSPRR